MPDSAPESAIVLFSGGQDSTVCLAWALARFAFEPIQPKAPSGSLPGQSLALGLAIAPGG